MIEISGYNHGELAIGNPEKHMEYLEKLVTGKVKQYCKMWAAKTSSPIHIIKDAAHFSNGDNATQVNWEIETFIENSIIRTAEQRVN